MKVLIACEFSGIVRDAFIARGHDAWSCDLLPSERPGPHIQCDIMDSIFSPVIGVEAFSNSWDLMIAFPPCTHLASSGARWFKDKQQLQKDAVNFFMALTMANCPRTAIENPVGIMSTRYRKPDQIIQPWQFGHGETKATCLWLKGLPNNGVDVNAARVILKQYRPEEQVGVESKESRSRKVPRVTCSVKRGTDTRIPLGV